MRLRRRTFLRNALVGAGLGVAGVRRSARASATETQGPSKGLAPEESFAFCVIADPHCGEEMRSGIEEHGTAMDRLLTCFRQIEKLEGPDKPDFILLVGDIHPWVLKDHMDKMPIPIHAVAGNHESTNEKRQQLRDLFPEDFKPNGTERDYYSFLHHGVRFIGLCNAGAGGEHIGQFCSEVIRPRGQCEWLETELSQPEACKIVFGHIPPEQENRDRNMYISRNDSRWFNALVEDTVPTALFFGHLHRPTQEYEIGATRCFNVRSCCWNSGQADLGFLVVRVTPEGIATREIITGTFEPA